MGDSRMDYEKFKTAAMLRSFHVKYPGALAAHFLHQVQQRMRGASGVASNVKQLKDISMVDFIGHGHSGLTEVRDVREAQTIAQVIDLLNRQLPERAVDVLVMRLQAVMKAKSKGGTWEKAMKMELIGESTGDLLPPGVSGLAS